MCLFLSFVQLFVILWTVACPARLSMGFSRQVYWSGLPFSSPGDLPDPGIEPASPALVGRFFTTEPPGKPSDSYPLWSYAMDRGAWQAMVHRVTKSQTQLKQHSMHTWSML